MNKRQRKQLATRADIEAVQAALVQATPALAIQAAIDGVVAILNSMSPLDREILKFLLSETPIPRDDEVELQARVMRDAAKVKAARSKR